jgi:hypothetical protein
MIYNVIPINYAGGLGGQFLSAFICAARENKPGNWVFSKDGNAHNTDKDLGSPPCGIGQDPTSEKNTAHLIEYSKTVPEDIIVYPHGHYADPDLLMQYFYKQIKIYADPNQIEEIIGVFMLKSPKNRIHFKNLTNPIEQEKYNKYPMVTWKRFASTKFTRLHNNCPDLEPRMLNISWNDMLYNDPEVLISKLYQFTEIPEKNFSRDKFNEWRMLTHKTVDRLKEAGIIT